MSGAICDVCGEQALGVCSSALGAVSFAYCQVCTELGAEPYGITVYGFAMDGGVFEKWSDGYQEMIYVTVLRAGKTSEEFWADVAKAKYDFENDPLINGSLAEETTKDGDYEF